MSGNALVGKDGKVALGANKVVGQGAWSLNLGSTDEFDASEFGDEWEMIKYGMRRGGTISFNGHYYPADNTGQGELESAFVLGTDLTDLRLYFNSTSYWRPNRTAGYWSPTLTTGAGTPVSTVRITSCDIGMDKSGLGTISFTAKPSGVFVRN